MAGGGGGGGGGEVPGRGVAGNNGGRVPQIISKRILKAGAKRERESTTTQTLPEGTREREIEFSARSS